MHQCNSCPATHTCTDSTKPCRYQNALDNHEPIDTGQPFVQQSTGISTDVCPPPVDPDPPFVQPSLDSGKYVQRKPVDSASIQHSRKPAKDPDISKHRQSKVREYNYSKTPLL